MRNELELSAEERARLEDLISYSILDTAPEPEFDDFTTLASEICKTPIAIITLLDENRQWFKSRLGIEVTETPRAVAFCDHTVSAKKFFVVPDALADPRFRDNPLVTGSPYIRFYAGAPLRTEQNRVIGTLAVIDFVPRQLASDQKRALDILARHVMVLMELRKNVRTLARAVSERERAEQALKLTQADLENRVRERSAELISANAALRIEVAEKIQEKDLSERLINSLPGMFYLFDNSGQFLRWNENFTKVTGFSDHETACAHPLDFFETAEDKHLIAEKIQEAFDSGYTQVEAPLRAKSGKLIPHLFNAVRVQIGDKRCLSGMGIDITDRKLFENSLRDAEERYRRLIELSPDAIFIMKGRLCTFANKAGLSMVGAQSQEQLSNKSILDLVHQDYRNEVLLRIQRLEHQREHVERLEQQFIQLDGTTIDVEVAAAPFQDGGEAAQLLVVRDITESNRQKEQLKRQANFDDLTGLANRHVLQDRIARAMAHADRTQTAAVIAFVDLDNFKLINDTLGHELGDHLLVQVAARLSSCVRGEDTVCRYGGDEFVLVLSDNASEEATTACLGRIATRISKPFNVNGHQLYITCSVGLSVYPQDALDVPTLLRHADAAMYEAKSGGRNQFRYFISSMNERIHERFAMEAGLRRALEQGEFVLYYQPQVNLGSGKVSGVEALIRWKDPERGMQSPLKFISVAEETGLIVPIGQWVLEQACVDMQRLKEAGLAHLTVSVNLSPRQFRPQRLVESIVEALRAAGLDGESLKLEVTESTLMQDPEQARQILSEIGSLGVRTSIDDFGIGYSSLNYLRHFPVDQLKIDQSFVQGLGQDPSDAAIVEAVISLGHSLKLEVVAEGVCSDQQLVFLRERRCDQIQGNYFCEAVPFAQLEHYLYRELAQ